MAGSGTAASRYEALSTIREDFLRSARRSSQLTLPYLVVPNGFTSGQELYKPYQSIGARGVNNLASKMLLTLMADPFFRLMPEQEVAEELNQSDPRIEAEVERALIAQERNIQREITETGDRNPMFEAFKHLIVAGNVLLFMHKQGVTSYPLDKYVVRRDPDGQPLEIVLKECFAYETLPEEAREIVAATGNGPVMNHSEKTYDIYTHIVRKPSQWYVYQELCGQKVPDTDGQYPLDKSPWLPLRFVRIAGEDYGRGYVEEYVGDLISLEALSQAVVEASEAGAKVLFLVNPTGATDEQTVASAPNLAVREGRAEDVTVVQVAKQTDLRVARETMSAIETRLSWAFLLNRAVQRQAERVTAEEIRFMAQELEDALGGVYSLMSQEFQLPYVKRKMDIMAKAGKLPHLPKDAVRPIVITGFDAIGRSHERTKLVGFISDIQGTLGEAAFQYLDVPGIIARLANADAIDTQGLLKSPEQVAQEQQQAQMMQLAAKAAPQAVSAMGQVTAAQQQSEETDVEQ